MNRNTTGPVGQAQRVDQTDGRCIRHPRTGSDADGNGSGRTDSLATAPCTTFGSAVGMGFSEDAVLRRHLANLQIGLLGFIFPSLAFRILVPKARGDMIPSVMCHFAAILAACLFVLVLRERRIAPPAP